MQKSEIKSEIMVIWNIVCNFEAVGPLELPLQNNLKTLITGTEQHENTA